MIQMKNSTRSISIITMENTGDKLNSYHHSHREAILCYHKLTPCVVSKKNWDKKEDKGKCVLQVLFLAKGQVSGDIE